jgi:hypothetical protein
MPVPASLPNLKTGLIVLATSPALALGAITTASAVNTFPGALTEEDLG